MNAIPLTRPSSIPRQSHALSNLTPLQVLPPSPVFFPYLLAHMFNFKVFYDVSLSLLFQQLRALLSKFDVKFNTEDVEDLISKTNMSTASTMKCLNIEA